MKSEENVVYKKCNLHLLTSKKPIRANQILQASEKTPYLFLSVCNEELGEESFQIGKHLYVTSDEKKEHNAWYLDAYNNVCKYVDLTQYGVGDGAGQKIIATTDPELHKDGIPNIHRHFVGGYILDHNNKQTISEVLVEYEANENLGKYDICPQGGWKLENSTLTPKLREDCVCISRVKTLFTKYDLHKAFCDGCGFDMSTLDEGTYYYLFEEWYNKTF